MSNTDIEVMAMALHKTATQIDTLLQQLAHSTQHILIRANGEPCQQDWPGSNITYYKVIRDNELDYEARQFVRSRWPLIRWPDRDPGGWRVDVDGPCRVSTVPEYEWKVEADGDGFVRGIWDNELEDWSGSYDPRPVSSMDEPMNEEECRAWNQLGDISTLFVVLDDRGERVYESWNEDNAKDWCRLTNAERTDISSGAFPFISCWAYQLDGNDSVELFSSAGATIAQYEASGAATTFADGTYAGDGTNVVLRVFLLSACHGDWPVKTQHGYRYVKFKE